MVVACREGGEGRRGRKERSVEKLFLRINLGAF